MQSTGKRFSRAALVAAWAVLVAGAPTDHWAQDARTGSVVRGTVVSEDGAPLSAVHVQIEGRAIQS
jgi:hypothetical protein